MLFKQKVVVFKSSKSRANTANSLRKQGSIFNCSPFSFLQNPLIKSKTLNTNRQSTIDAKGELIQTCTCFHDQNHPFFINCATLYYLLVYQARADLEYSFFQTFTGNKDRNTVVTHWFPEITARHLRVLPLKWSGLTNCMRIELYGCRNGKPGNGAVL